MGLPVIVSSRCGAAEIVRDGANGWVCEADDAAGIASKVKAAGAHAGDALSRAARTSAEAFGIDTMAKQLADLYATL